MQTTRWTGGSDFMIKRGAVMNMNQLLYFAKWFISVRSCGNNSIVGYGVRPALNINFSL
ncbi:MAG: hypothetical protein LBJ26_23920 [Paenibacillus sp.]|nr:hypothetical protein [Paenibacillus sp.]